MARKSSRFAAAVHLDGDEAVTIFIDAALAASRPARMAEALRVTAFALGMSEIAAAAGISRDRLFRALARPGSAHNATIARALRAMRRTEVAAANLARPGWRGM